MISLRSLQRYGMFWVLVMVFTPGKSVQGVTMVHAKSSGFNCGKDNCQTGYFCDRVEGRCSLCSLPACRQTNPPRDCQCTELLRENDNTVASKKGLSQNHAVLDAVIRERLEAVLGLLRIELVVVVFVQITAMISVILALRANQYSRCCWRKSKDDQSNNMESRDVKNDLEPKQSVKGCYPGYYFERPVANNLTRLGEFASDGGVINCPDCQQCVRTENHSDTEEKDITDGPSMEGSTLLEDDHYTIHGGLDQNRG